MYFLNLSKNNKNILTNDIARGNMGTKAKGDFSMEQTKAQRLAGVLRGLVILALVCNLLCLCWCPDWPALADCGPDVVRRAFWSALGLPGYEEGTRSLLCISSLCGGPGQMGRRPRLCLT